MRLREKYKESYRRLDKLYNAKRKYKAKQYVDSFKNRPCTDCKQCFPTVCMDFDHLGNKFKGISAMLRYPLEKIKIEIDKCELVCSNCHRIRTKNRFACVTRR